MRYLAVILMLISTCSSCLPLRVAPKIDDHKIKLANKFNRKLPDVHAFIFKDPGNEGDFYYFLNEKYCLNERDVKNNVPVVINNKSCFLSFYEVAKPTKYLNLFPVLFELTFTALGSDDADGGEITVEREEHWYLVLTVSDAVGTDCLSPGSERSTETLQYLKILKQDYLSKWSGKKVMPYKINKESSD